MLMFANISCCLFKIAWLKSRTGQHHFCHCCQTAKNSHKTKQLLHSIEVNIRICQPETVMFIEAKPRLTYSDINLSRMHQLYNFVGTH